MKNYASTIAGARELLQDMVKISQSAINEGHGMKCVGSLQDSRDGEIIGLLHRLGEIVREEPSLESVITAEEVDRITNQILDDFNKAKHE